MKRTPTLEHVVMAVFVLMVTAAVAGPIDGNSMLVHLRTGIDMFERSAIPRADSYSFTAPGEPWVVQSWLASWVYGLLHEVGGYRLVIVLQMVLAALTGFLMATLARSGTMLRTAAACLAPFVIAFLSWSQRPLLFGVLCFALVVWVVSRQRSCLWLLPVVWVWVNTHGSFPIGAAWIVAVAIGQWIDTRRVPARELRFLAAFMGGLALGALNPLGPKILLFFTAAIGERAESFADITEWGSPEFQDLGGALTLGALLVLFVSGFAGKVRWVHIVPVVGLLGASLYSNRHLALLAIAMCPLMAEVLKRTVTTDEQERSEKRVAVIGMAFVVLTAAFLTARIYERPSMDVDEFPVAGVQRMENEGLLTATSRVLTRESTACYVIWRNGGGTPVFMDDRIDMYPVSVSSDYRHLFHGDAAPQPILDRYRIDAVLWDVDKPLTNTLAVDRRWRMLWQTDGVAAFVRT